MNVVDSIVGTVLAAYLDTQAIYLFGSWGTEEEWPSSDVDIALLLPPEEAKQAGSLALIDLRFALEDLLKKDLDLINLRLVPTIFQKEIILAERRICCADRYAADEFEMLVLSFYQKLNQERDGIMVEGLRSGRFHDL